MGSAAHTPLGGLGVSRRFVASASALLLLGGGSAFLAGWHLGETRGREPRVVTGTAYPNHDATAIALTPAHGASIGFTVAGSPWRQDDGPWHDKGPNCLTPLKSGQRVRLGVIETNPSDSVPLLSALRIKSL